MNQGVCSAKKSEWFVKQSVCFVKQDGCFVKQNGCFVKQNGCFADRLFRASPECGPTSSFPTAEPWRRLCQPTLPAGAAQ